MIIAIDVDEVLATLLNPVIDYHNDMYNTSLTREKFQSYNWWETWGGTKEEAIAKFYDFWETDYPNRIRPIEGSIEGVKAIKKKHELIVITSRQLDFEEQTKKWIQQYFPDTFTQVHFTNALPRSGETRRKVEICLETGAEVLIEDNLSQASECAKAGVRVFLFDCPWNQSESLPQNITRVKSWDEIIAAL